MSVKQAFPFLGILLGLVVGIMPPVAFGQDYFPVQVPSDAQTAKDMVEDIKNIDDIPGSDAAILYQELVSARNGMMRYRKYKSSVHQSDFDQLKNDFSEQIVSLRQLPKNCDHQNSSDVHDRLQEIRNQNQDLFFAGSYPNTGREFRKLLSMRQEDLCKLVKSGDLPIVRIHEQEVDTARKLATDQILFANQIADAYQDRYRKLQKSSGRTSEATLLRITLLIIVVGVCLFAWLIFRGVTVFDKSLQTELIVSGQLIQFPTVMILLVVVVVLGMSGILDDKTLGTLLGGIAGYVLSQGIGRAASRETERALTVRPGGTTPTVA